MRLLQFPQVPNSTKVLPRAAGATHGHGLPVSEPTPFEEEVAAGDCADLAGLLQPEAREGSWTECP